VPAILFNRNYIEIVITLTPAGPKKPVAADEDQSLEKNDLFNKNSSKISYAKGLRINAELLTR
jgi:hypothetical protein